MKNKLEELRELKSHDEQLTINEQRHKGRGKLSIPREALREL